MPPRSRTPCPESLGVNPRAYCSFLSKSFLARPRSVSPPFGVYSLSPLRTKDRIPVPWDRQIEGRIPKVSNFLRLFKNILFLPLSNPRRNKVQFFSPFSLAFSWLPAIFNTQLFIANLAPHLLWMLHSSRFLDESGQRECKVFEAICMSKLKMELCSRFSL